MRRIRCDTCGRSAPPDVRPGQRCPALFAGRGWCAGTYVEESPTSAHTEGVGASPTETEPLIAAQDQANDAAASDLTSRANGGRS